ncbi:Flagellar hook-length control protein FliK [Arcticibacter svalbardensis MN12-7]|uniref:Flagellar hook-length control protein FliK n=1 Tax=Arcticibacter svalbardensis MN12-7 TaxID=1150600 RepID=R9GWZ9_9SPHI|nr:ice-binding family protein [Arcticibacter svalbardensis]EOR96153.1 Flagellar hook-length control protein FliK [Arcticibacter svalbardensis MN12-7]
MYTNSNGTSSIRSSQYRNYSKFLQLIGSLTLLALIFVSGCKKEDATAENLDLTAFTSASALTSTLTSTAALAPINLRTANDFTILTETGITTTGVTSVLGDIGTSPIGSTAITGFDLIMSTDNQSSHTPIVTGKVYGPNYAAPTPSKMTTAIGDMETAFTTANGIVDPSPVVELYAGNLSGRTIKAGLYKFSTNVLVTNAGVTLTGGPNDVWVFQIAQDLIVNNTAKITLAGGAQAKNVFWVVSGQTTLGTYSAFSGVILCKTLIALNTGATVKGKLFAQTAVTMIANTVKP